MKHLLLLLCLLAVMISDDAHAQISFEKGYYVTNDGQKIECLIKNMDSRNNPTSFEYKTLENSEAVTVDITEAKEFGVYDVFRYIRSTVKIDKSSDDPNKLTHEKNPVFVEEQLFLKVLVEGKSNLYLYDNDYMQKFFYNIDNAPIEQLIYIRYLTSVEKGIEYSGNINITKYNNQFRQQILNNLKCSTIKANAVEKLVYTKNDLVNFFIEYNKCTNSNFIDRRQKVKSDWLNITPRVHLRNSSLEIDNIYGAGVKTNFGSKLGFGFGVEAEFLLPFNKNKWAVLVEPTYQTFKSEKDAGTDFSGRQRTVTVNYNSIELPLGARYYHFFNKNSKIFANASYIIDIDLGSTVDFKIGNIFSNSINVRAHGSLAFGAGYKFKNKYGLEMRYQTSRNILGEYLFWSSNHSTVSLIFGYTLL